MGLSARGQGAQRRCGAVALGALFVALVLGGCASEDRMRRFSDFSKCDPRDSGYAWCEAKQRAQSGEWSWR